MKKISSAFCASAIGPTMAVLLMGIGLSACSSLGLTSKSEYGDKNKEKLYENGSLASDEGGFSIFGSKSKKIDETGIGVNGYLWRATLDTISFMPVSSADPFGGLVTTDWYSAPGEPGERIKLNIFILDRELRADGVKVTVFRQTRNMDGSWIDSLSSPMTATSLEETILTRARQMKLAQKEKK